MKRLLLLSLLLMAQATSAAIPPVSTYNYEAEAWRVRVVANGGSLTGLAYRTGTRFMNQSRRWDFRRYLGRTGIYIGTGTNAMCVPIVGDWFTSANIPDSLVAFVSTDYSEATGLTGNTTSKHLVLNGANGIDLTAFTSVTNMHLATYVRTASSQSGYTMGLSFSGSSTTCGLPVSYANVSYLELATVAHQVSVADTTGTGFYVSTRRSANRGLWKNGSTILTSTTADTGSLGGGQSLVHALNSAGTPGNWTDRALSYYCYGYGMPDEKQTAYKQAVYNIQEAYNRQ